MPFLKVQHKVSTFDAQPSNESGGILVTVTGALLVRLLAFLPSRSSKLITVVRKVDEEQRPMNYTQTFQLLPDGAGSYFVFNDVFRLIYG